MSSAKIITAELDQSQTPPASTGLYGLFLGAFDKGRVGEKIFISNVQQRDLKLGKPKIGSDVAYFVHEYYLSKSQRSWAVRVAKNALYGGVRVAATFISTIGTGNGVLTSFSGVVSKARCHESTLSIYQDKKKIGYDNGTGTITGTGLSGTINYHTGAVSLTFTTAPPTNSTIYAVWGLANQSLSAGIADPSSYTFNGYAITEKLNMSGLVCADKLVPEDLVTPVGVVSSAANATVKIYDNGVLRAYADETGSIVDSGATAFIDTSQPHAVNYVTGVIDFKVDAGYTVTGPVTAQFSSLKAEAFLLVQDNPGAWGSDYYELIDNVDFKTYTFDLTTFYRDARGVNTAVEKFSTSRKHQLGGNNTQMYLEDRITGKSDFIRVYDNPNLADTEAFPQISLNHNSMSAVTLTQLTGGTNGDPVNVTDYVTALAKFKNRDAIQVDIVVDTLADPTYQLELIKFCDRDFGGRGDCVAVLQLPYDIEVSNNYISDAVDYRNYTLNASSSFAALYWGHPTVLDSYNNREINVPHVGFVAANIAYTADQYEVWYPVAGWTRGKLPVRDVLVKLEEGERDILADNGINPIKFKPGKGIATWGHVTLYGSHSAEDRLNVRLLLVKIERDIEDYLEDREFDLNDKITRASVKLTVENYLLGIKSRRGLYDLRVVCDDSNNSSEDVDNYRLNIDYYIEPVKGIEVIKQRVIIVSTGRIASASFTTIP